MTIARGALARPVAAALALAGACAGCVSGGREAPLNEIYAHAAQNIGAQRNP
jgi:hypothetical protein